MRLKLIRKQNQSGVFSKSASFVLEAKVDLTEQERHCVEKYKLGSLVIYDSEAFRKNMDAAVASHNRVGQLARLAMAKMSLSVTVSSLTDGQVIACSTLDEALAAEEAIRNACANLKNYLETAETYDGREETVEIETFKEPVEA